MVVVGIMILSHKTESNDLNQNQSDYVMNKEHGKQVWNRDIVRDDHLDLPYGKSLK